MKSKFALNTVKKIIFSLVGFMMMTQVSFAQYSNWEMVYSSTGELSTIKQFSFVPGPNGLWETGWAAQFDGTILKTTDAGENWSIIHLFDDYGIWGISFVDELTGYVVNTYGSVHKTTDGGITWVEQYNDANTPFNKIAFKDANNGVVTGYPKNLVTSNGGATWTAENASFNVWNLDYAAGNTYFGVEALTGEVAKTDDNGQTWSSVYNTGMGITSCTNFLDGAHGIVGGTEFEISLTTDGGATWVDNTVDQGNGDILSADWFDQDTIWVSGSGIYKSIDGGENWALDTTMTESGFINREIYVTGLDVIIVSASNLGTGEIQIWRKVGPPPIEADFVAEPVTVCAGSSVSFTDLSVGPIDTWNWAFEGGSPATSTAQNPTIVYNTPGVYDVSLTVSVGALDDTKTKTNYINVVLLPGQPGLPTGATSVCTGTTETYTTGEVQYAETYDWEINPTSAGTLSLNMNSATLTVSDTWTGDFTIRVRASNVCGNSEWSDELLGTVFKSPNPYDLIGGGEICEGGPGLEIELNNSETGVDYELYKNEVATGNIVSGTGEPISFGLFTEAGNYTALGFTDYCSTMQYGEANITISLLPTQLAVPVGANEVCNNEEAEYTTTGAHGTDNVIWALSPENAGELSVDGMTAVIIWNAGFEGNASLTVWAENSCGSGPVSDPLEIMVLAAPSPEVSGDNLVCKEEVSVYSTTLNAGNIYGWEVIGGLITNEQGISEITVTWGDTPGIGYIIVNELVESGCSAADTLAVTIDDCTGIDDFSQNNKLSIYPNPATNFVNVQSQVKLLSVSILNSEAKTLISKDVDGFEMKINTNDLDSGVYFIQIISEQETVVKKLIIK